MYKICVFAGTTEGREIVEFLSFQQVEVTACVATEYGEMLLPKAGNLHISAQRLTEAEMKALFCRERFDLVIDATHPYASAVTENIAAACNAAGTAYHRLLRTDTDVPENGIFVESAVQAAAYLDKVEGNILLTTGSKELQEFSSIHEFAQRVYARVLPMEESLRLCREAGLKPGHIIAMQGPFTVDMNVAMLKSVGASYLVTKASSNAGGFGEKIAAAEAAGVVPVIIGRPPQREGTDMAATMELLCRRFSFRQIPQVTLVGIGPGSRQALTGEAREALSQADCILGAGRMLETAAEPGQAVHAAIAPEEIRDYIQQHKEFRRFAVALSGDAGFFSGSKKLLPLLSDCRVTVLPGVSSLAYLCARLGMSYENVLPVSLHGRENAIQLPLAKGKRVFVLAGGENGMGKLCRTLAEAGMGSVQVWAGQRLSYPDEKIFIGTAEELQTRNFDSLCAAVMEYPGGNPSAVQGLPDEAFLRTEAVPMTKSEVRAICLSKMALKEESLAWDIGAGTGSVTVEMAWNAWRGRVYAIERKKEAVDILRANCRNFHVDNVTIVSGTAPEDCRDLPAPTHAFIGGSSGNMKEILALLLEKNPDVRFVATAVSLESVGELIQCSRLFSFRKVETVSITAARGRKAGPYTLMSGQNPIYIFTMQGGTPECTA